MSIANGEGGASVRAKINQAFSDIRVLSSTTAGQTSDILTLQSDAAKVFSDVASLLADTTLGYSQPTPNQVVAGDIISAGGFRYEVALAGASDHHRTTAGGVKLYVLPSGSGYNVKAFGAVGNGATDDATAFNAAIAALNAISGPATLRVEGSFVVNGSLSAITTTRKTIDCYGATITHNGGTLFTFGTGGNVGVVLGLRYVCPSSPTAGTCAFAVEGANQVTFRDIVGQVNCLLKAGLTAYAGGYTLDNVQVNTINGTQTVIDHGDGANSSIRRLVLTAIGTSRVLDQTTLSGATATAIKFGAGGWDTVIWDDLLVNGYLYGLQIDRTSFAENVSNGKISNFFFDYCANGIELRNTAAGGGINNWHFSNGWVVGMDGYGVRLVGSVSTHRNIQFQNIHSLLAGKNNWRLEAASMSDVVLSNCVGEFANRFSATNTASDQDDFVALAGGWVVHGCRFGRSANNVVVASVPNWQARYGVTVSPNLANWRVENSILEGLTADCQLSVGATTISAGAERSSFVRNNSRAGGAGAPAYAVSNAIAVPASTVVQTNNTPFSLTLHFYGGTVTSITHNGIQVGSSGPATLGVEPGDTWSVTYTVAPTIVRVVRP